MARGYGTLCKEIVAGIMALCVVAVVVAVCVVYIPRDIAESNGHYLKIKVNNTAAFDSGGASHHPTKGDNGIGAGTDKYVLYTGTADKFPPSSQWASFDDMWDINADKMIRTSCSDHGWGENNSDDETENLRKAIQSVAEKSLVDNRFIFSIIMQETKGCVRAHSTNNGVNNPGLMQSHNGTSYDPEHSSKTIRQMVQDGTQGTPYGKGLAQYLDKYGNPYAAARGYNSGAVAANGDLSDAIGATTCYASDVANRLTGWVKAESLCVDTNSTTTSTTGAAGSSASPTSTSQWGRRRARRG